MAPTCRAFVFYRPLKKAGQILCQDQRQKMLGDPLRQEDLGLQSSVLSSPFHLCGLFLLDFVLLLSV